MDNRWGFRPAAGGCDVDFFISYTFKSLLLQALVGSLFDRVFRRYTRAFEERAHRVYGSAGRRCPERPITPAAPAGAGRSAASIDLPDGGTAEVPEPTLHMRGRTSDDGRTQIDEADGLGRAAAARTGNSGNRNGDVGSCPRVSAPAAMACATSALTAAMPGQQLGGNAKLLLLGRI